MAGTFLQAMFPTHQNDERGRKTLTQKGWVRGVQQGMKEKDLVFAMLTKFTKCQVLEKTHPALAFRQDPLGTKRVLLLQRLLREFCLMDSELPRRANACFYKVIQQITVEKSHDILRMHRENTGTVEEAGRSSSESGRVIRWTRNTRQVRQCANCRCF